ncbi:MAG: hypothetical protein JKY20_07975 [Alphaproteobacteria bacterium]|nr:hypothetical protein [Alphaproteobacteria bacterium]
MKIRFAISLLMIVAVSAAVWMGLPHLGAPNWLKWVISLAAFWGIMAIRHPAQRNTDTS